MGHTSSQISASVFPAGSLTLTVASGSPIRVQSILLSTGTAASAARQFTITDNDDTTLFVVGVPADSSIFMDLDSHFNNGLKIVGIQDTSAAVFHTSPGN